MHFGHLHACNHANMQAANISVANIQIQCKLIGQSVMKQCLRSCSSKATSNLASQPSSHTTLSQTLVHLSPSILAAAASACLPHSFKCLPHSSKCLPHSSKCKFIFCDLPCLDLSPCACLSVDVDMGSSEAFQESTTALRPAM